MEALIFLMKNYDANEIINAGSGKELTIEALANMIGEVVEFKGRIVFDPSKPDGTPQKIMDSSRINKLGWTYKISLHQGLQLFYEYYLTEKEKTDKLK